jgi:hypothetical protein
MSKRADLEGLESLEHSPRVERALEVLFSAATPDAAFIAGLERQLVARTNARPAGESPLRRFRARWVQSFGQRRWAMMAVSLVLIVAVAVAAIGPQRVLASIQQLLGYVPGVGFVDLENTRVLAAPVEVSRDGVTLRVEQVLAQPDRTVIVIRSQGLPPGDHVVARGPEEADFQVWLRLPNGRTLRPKDWSVRTGEGFLTFPSLPDDVYRVTLELSRLPLVRPGAAPEDWAVSLSLRPATGDLAAELFPQPYALSDASDTHADVTLRVLEVAHSPEETVLRLQVQWPDPDWERPHIGGNRLPHLQDDLGHMYREGPPPGVGSVAQMEVERIAVDTEATPTPTLAIPTYEETLAFAPASPSAQHLTLWVDAVEFEVPAEDSFTVDLGDDPQIGDRWSLDVHLTVAGFPVHITGARLVEEEWHGRDGPAKETLLQFDIGPVPDQDDRALRGIGLESETPGFNGGGGGYNYSTNRLRASLNLREGQSIPTSPIEVRVNRASVLIRGPWNVAWTVPGADEASEAKVAPVTLHPAKASQIRAGLTLYVDKVTLTDRLVAVTVKGKSLSPDVTVGWNSPSLEGPFNWILEWHPATWGSEGQPPEKDLYLEDDWGRRYAHTRRIGWRPRGEQTSEALETPEVSATLVFEPVQPLARRLTLHVPAVRVTLPGAAAFDVTVPDGVEMQPSSDRPWSASAPWNVGIPVEIAGYPLRFTQARQEELHGTTLLVLTSAPFEGQQGNHWLAALRLASVTAPDGRAVDLRSSFSHAGLGDDTGGLQQATLAFDVIDPETRTVQPGRHHVELDGAIVAVEGPWQLTWDLRAR